MSLPEPSPRSLTFLYNPRLSICHVKNKIEQYYGLFTLREGKGGGGIIVSHGSQGAVAYRRIVTPYNFPDNVLFSTRVIM